MANPDDLLHFTGSEPDVEVRSESDREIGIRFMKYGEIGRTESGLEVFEAGAFEGTDPTSIILRSEHEGPPAGRGLRLEEREDSAVLIARAAPTPRGDELMTLAKEGYFRGASPSFIQKEGGSRHKYIGKDRVTVRTAVDLREVSLTWRPTYAGTEVLYARTQTLEDSPVADIEPVAALEAAPVRGVETQTDPHQLAEMRARLSALEERSSTKTDVLLPEIPKDDKQVRRGEWLKSALTLMDGQSLSPAQERDLADIITSDNPAFVPPAYATELIGVIDPSRPFMNSTRRVDMPDNGLSIIYPRITQRPTVAEQTTQKTEVSSAEVHTDTITRNVRTFAGAGDLSIQLLRRSSPEFLSFYLQLLAEAYAQVTEDAAVDALLAASPTAGTGDFDVEEPHFGEAFENGVSAGRTLVPNRIWLSTAALVALIDARTPSGGGGTPMYPGLAGLVGTTGGAAPLPINLQPVWTPALDNEAVDIIIGPSQGFAWAEEGTFTLQADVPGRLGRDVALGGFVVFIDLYPAAFTTYNLES